MSNSMNEVLDPDAAGNSMEFPNAPDNWNMANAESIASKQGISLTEDHWHAVSALQEYFARHKDIKPNMRELHDALDERFHLQGGIKYLYEILPGGPVAQGCRIAGIEPPAGTTDESFGSVQ